MCGERRLAVDVDAGLGSQIEHQRGASLSVAQDTFVLGEQRRPGVRLRRRLGIARELLDAVLDRAIGVAELSQQRIHVHFDACHFPESEFVHLLGR